MRSRYFDKIIVEQVERIVTLEALLIQERSAFLLVDRSVAGGEVRGQIIIKAGRETVGIEKLKGLFLGQQDVMEIEPKEPRLDRALTLRFAPKNRGSVRLSLGLFYTKEEWEHKRRELVSKRLP